MTGPEESRARRRASRAAGPAGNAAEAATATVAIPAPARAAAAAIRPVGPPPRRPADTGKVIRVAAAVGFTALVALGAVVGVLGVQNRHAEAAQQRDQRFIDTAVQTVMNMYTYTPDTINSQVDLFVAGTSGPLRDQMAANAENLKALLRESKHSSEAVINGTAIEAVDDVAANARVLVALRATATDADGVNKPSQPYALRVIVHEDDDGNMTAYDLQWPGGTR